MLYFRRVITCWSRNRYVGVSRPAWTDRMCTRFAIYDPDLAFVQERTALAHAMFHSVAGRLRQTYAATKDLHALSSLKLESSRLAKNRAAADRLRIAKSRDAERPTLKIAAS